MKSEIIQRYIHGDTLIIVSSLHGICEEIAKNQDITQNSSYLSLGIAAAFTAALAAEQKEDETYLTACFKWTKTGKSIAVTAFGDGRMCACIESFAPEADTDSTVLEVTRHSDVGGEYRSVVIGKNVQGAINAYISESMQRNAKWKTIRDGRKTTGIFVQELPGGADLRKTWDDIKPFFKVLDENELINAGCEFLGERELKFGCHCSRRSAQRILETIPPSERAALGKTAEIICKLCGKKYEIQNE